MGNAEYMGPSVATESQDGFRGRCGKLNSAVNLLCEVHLNSKQEIGLGVGNFVGIESKNWFGD